MSSFEFLSWCSLSFCKNLLMRPPASLPAPNVHPLFLPWLKSVSHQAHVCLWEAQWLPLARGSRWEEKLLFTIFLPCYLNFLVSSRKPKHYDKERSFGSFISWIEEIEFRLCSTHTRPALCPPTHNSCCSPSRPCRLLLLLPELVSPTPPPPTSPGLLENCHLHSALSGPSSSMALLCCYSTRHYCHIAVTAHACIWFSLPVTRPRPPKGRGCV